MVGPLVLGIVLVCPGGNGVKQLIISNSMFMLTNEMTCVSLLWPSNLIKNSPVIIMLTSVVLTS